MTRRGLSPRAGALAMLFAALVAVPFVLAGNAGATTPAPRMAVTCTGGTYTVVRGDGWWQIASKLKVTMAALLATNGATVGTMIHPGDVLCVPGGGVTTSTSKAVPSTSAAVTTTTRAPVTATTQPAPPINVTIRQFPVQGICFYVDTWQAPRSSGRKHQGVDILAPTGNAVYAAADGTLTKQYVDGPGSLAGNGWRLTRADGTYFFYGHFSRFAAGLKVGSTVKTGQIIGYVGMTGNAGAPHLHFEVHPRGGAAVNPTPIVRAVDGCATTIVPAQPGTVSPSTAPAGPTTTKPGVTTTT
ncbi:MAG: peptidoglycan DD-metalloendopeptidase family protein, partial [Ilumatobacteraceae bacterium]